jgi:hypothetical protein
MNYLHFHPPLITFFSLEERSDDAPSRPGGTGHYATIYFLDEYDIKSLKSFHISLPTS